MMAIGRKTARRVFETIQEVTDGKQRTDKLIDIFAEAVYAHLRQKGIRASSRHLRARRIELTTGGSRAGIGTQYWRGNVRMAETLMILGKAKR